MVQGEALESQVGPGTAAGCDVLWGRLDSAFQDFAEFRDASLDRWHRKADLASGQSLLRSGGLKALNQPISAQVRGSASVKSMCSPFTPSFSGTERLLDISPYQSIGEGLLEGLPHPWGAGVDVGQVLAERHAPAVLSQAFQKQGQ